MQAKPSSTVVDEESSIAPVTPVTIAVPSTHPASVSRARVHSKRERAADADDNRVTTAGSPADSVVGGSSVSASSKPGCCRCRFSKNGCTHCRDRQASNGFVQNSHPISKRCRIASAQPPSPPTAVSDVQTSRGKNPDRAGKGKSVDQSAPGPKRAKSTTARPAEVIGIDKGSSASPRDGPRVTCSLYSVGQRVEGDFSDKGINQRVRSKWYVGTVVQLEGEGSTQAITVLYDEDGDEQRYTPALTVSELRSHHYCDLTVLPSSVRSVTLSVGSRVRVKASAGGADKATAGGADGWTLGTVNSMRWDLGKHVRPGEMGDLKLAVLCDDPNGIDYESFGVGKDVDAKFASSEPAAAAEQSERWYRGTILESVKVGNRLHIKVKFDEGGRAPPGQLLTCHSGVRGRGSEPVRVGCRWNF